MPALAQAVRPGQALGDLGGLQAMAHQAHGLVVQHAVHVTLLGHVAHHALVAKSGPMVLCQHHITAAGIPVQGHMQILGPGQCVTHLRAAQRAQVVHGVVGVFSQVQCAFPGKIEVHFCRCFGVGRELELNRHAVDRVRLMGITDRPGRRNQSRPRLGQVFAQARVHLPRGPHGQGIAKLELRAPCHGHTSDDVFCHGMVQEARRRNHLHLARIHIGLGNEPRRTPKVVAMAVAVDHGVHGPQGLWIAVLAIQGQGRGSGLGAHQRVQGNQARITFNEGNVGDVKTAHLKDARRDLEQAVQAVQTRHTP